MMHLLVICLFAHLVSCRLIHPKPSAELVSLYAEASCPSGGRARRSTGGSESIPSGAQKGTRDSTGWKDGHPEGKNVTIAGNRINASGIAKRASTKSVRSRPGNAQVASIPLLLPKRSTKNLFVHLGKFVKLLFSQSLLSKSQLRKTLFYTILGSLVPVFVSIAGYSELVYEYMRSNWAFQGEFHYKMEDYTRVAHLVFIADLVLRVLLRLNLYSDTLSVDIGENVYAAWIVRSLVGIRLAFLSYVHYVLFSHNWNTASFVVSPRVSKWIGKVTVEILVASILFNLFDSLAARSLDNFFNITHLVSPAKFKTEILNSKILEEFWAIAYNMPRVIRENLMYRACCLATVAHTLDKLKRYVPHTIDWVNLFLNLTLALYSNSAAGLYLSALQAVSNVVDDRMCSIERKALS